MFGSAKTLPSILIGVLLVFGCVAVAAADSSPPRPKNGITISPPLKELTIGPGLLKATTDIGLTNNTDRDIGATIKVVDFKALDEFGGVSLGQAGIPVSKYGLANWMSVSGLNGNSLTLRKDQTANLKVSIDNRADLAPGGHYGAVVVTASSPDNLGGNKVSFNQELVSLLFVKKLGGEHYGLQLQSLTAPKGSEVPTTASLRFRSTGNVQVVPRGYVSVTDPKGKLVAKGVIDPESTLVLPDTSRQFVTLLQPVGDATVVGKYKITAYYRHDGQTNFEAMSIYFNHGAWSPRTTIILVLTGAFAVLVLYKLRRFKKR